MEGNENLSADTRQGACSQKPYEEIHVVIQIEGRGKRQENEISRSSEMECSLPKKKRKNETACKTTPTKENSNLPSKIGTANLSETESFSNNKESKKTPSTEKEEPQISKISKSTASKTSRKSQIIKAPKVKDIADKNEEVFGQWYLHDGESSTSYPYMDDSDKQMLAKKNKGSYCCYECQDIFKTFPELVTHLFTHTTKSPRICESCGTGFILLMQAQQHKDRMKQWPREMPYECDQCSMGFTTKYLLDFHQESHRNPDLVQCNRCSKYFKNGNLFLQHCSKGSCTLTEESFLPEEKCDLLCNVCRESFHSPSQMYVHLKSHAGFKTYICFNCGIGYDNIDNESSKKHKRECHKDLPNLGHQCEICDDFFASSELLMVHKKEHFGILLYQCHACHYRFKFGHSLYYHLQDPASKCKVLKGEKFTSWKKCALLKQQEEQKRALAEFTGKNDHVEELKASSVCGIEIAHTPANNLQICKTLESTSIDNITDFGNHISCLSLHISGPFQKQLPEKEEKIFRCDSCEKRFSNFNSLFVHLINHNFHYDFQICDICGLGLKNSTALKQHKLNHFKTKEELLFECSICGERFQYADLLTLHHDVKHKGKPRIYCEGCDLGFEYREFAKFRNHYQFHKGKMKKQIGVNIKSPESVECLLCDKRMGPKNAKFHFLDQHSLHCFSCDLDFKTFGEFRSHVKQHTDEYPFKCGRCKNVYSEINHLNFHLNIHKLMEKDCFVCKICNFLFLDKQKYESHRCQHTCNGCGQTLNSIKAAKNHRVKCHKKPSKYVCSNCGEVFNNGTMFASHCFEGYLPKDAVCCSICFERFLSKSDLDSHVESQHTKLKKDRRKKSVQEGKEPDSDDAEDSQSNVGDELSSEILTHNTAKKVKPCSKNDDLGENVKMFEAKELMAKQTCDIKDSTDVTEINFKGNQSLNDISNVRLSEKTLSNLQSYKELAVSLKKNTSKLSGNVVLNLLNETKSLQNCVEANDNGQQTLSSIERVPDSSLQTDSVEIPIKENRLQLVNSTTEITKNSKKSLLSEVPQSVTNSINSCSVPTVSLNPTGISGYLVCQPVVNTATQEVCGLVPVMNILQPKYVLTCKPESNTHLQSGDEGETDQNLDSTIQSLVINSKKTAGEENASLRQLSKNLPTVTVSMERLSPSTISKYELPPYQQKTNPKIKDKDQNADQHQRTKFIEKPKAVDSQESEEVELNNQTNAEKNINQQASHTENVVNTTETEYFHNIKINTPKKSLPSPAYISRRSGRKISCPIKKDLATQTFSSRSKWGKFFVKRGYSNTDTDSIEIGKDVKGNLLETAIENTNANCSQHFKDINQSLETHKPGTEQTKNPDGTPIRSSEDLESCSEATLEKQEILKASPGEIGNLLNFQDDTGSTNKQVNDKPLDIPKTAKTRIVRRKKKRKGKYIAQEEVDFSSGKQGNDISDKGLHKKLDSKKKIQNNKSKDSCDSITLPVRQSRRKRVFSSKVKMNEESPYANVQLTKVFSKHLAIKKEVNQTNLEMQRSADETKCFDDVEIKLEPPTCNSPGDIEEQNEPSCVEASEDITSCLETDELIPGFEVDEDIEISVPDPVKVFQCSVCDTWFGNHRYLYLHLFSQHPGYRSHVCFTCGKGEKSSNSNMSLSALIMKHDQTHKNETFKFRCDKDGCLQAFRFKELLELHQITKHGEHSVLRCDLCRSTLKEKTRFVHHYKRCLKKKYIDPILGIQQAEIVSNENSDDTYDNIFNERTQSLENIDEVAGEIDINVVEENTKKESRIVVNGNSLKSGDSSVDEKTEKIIKPNQLNKFDMFYCGLCQGKFLQLETFYYHLFLHTSTQDERPYICWKCGYGHTEHNEHDRIHDGQDGLTLKYSCSKEGCTEHFANPSLKRLHEKKHSKGKDQVYECIFCKGKPKTLEDLQVHFNSHEISQKFSAGIQSKINDLNVANSKSDITEQISSDNEISIWRMNKVCGTGEKGALVKQESNFILSKLDERNSQDQTLKYAGDKDRNINIPKLFDQLFTKSELINYGFKVKSQSSQNGIFLCEICQDSHLDIGEFCIHLSEHAGNRPELCLSCGKGTNSSHYGARLWRKKHEIEHRNNTDGLEHSCATCSLRFARAEFLDIHKNLHMQKGVIDCKTCGKNFNFGYPYVYHLSSSVCKSMSTMISNFKEKQSMHTDNKDISENCIPERPLLANVKIDTRLIRKDTEKNTSLLKDNIRDNCESAVNLGKCINAGEKPVLTLLEKRQIQKKKFLKLQLKFQAAKKSLMTSSKSSKANGIICCVCKRFFMYGSYLCEHGRSEVYLNAHICCHCGKIFRSPSSLNIHIKRVHNKNKSYSCDICGIRFGVDKDLYRHLTCVHKVEKSKEDHDQTSDHVYMKSIEANQFEREEDKRFVFDAVNNLFQSSNVEDYIVKENGKFICKSCGINIKNLTSMKTHIRRKHFLKKKEICHICNKGFAFSNDLKSHISLCHEGQPQKCSVCAKTLKTKRALRGHMQRYHKELFVLEMRFPCPHCGMKFGYVKELNDHKRLYHSNMKFDCDLCGKFMASARGLRKHVERIHRNEESLSRDIASKIKEQISPKKGKQKTMIASYSNQQGVKMHQQGISFDSQDKHVTYSLVTAEDINRSREIETSDAIAFIQHMLEQGSPKPRRKRQLPIDTCIEGEIRNAYSSSPMKERYDQQNSPCKKSRHISGNDIHTDEFCICHHCGELYFNASALRSHINKVHGKPCTLRCNFCEEVFKSDSKATLHRREFHRKIRSNAVCFTEIEDEFKMTTSTDVNSDAFSVPVNDPVKNEEMDILFDSDDDGDDMGQDSNDIADLEINIKNEADVESRSSEGTWNKDYVKNEIMVENEMKIDFKSAEEIEEKEEAVYIATQYLSPIKRNHQQINSVPSEMITSNVQPLTSRNVSDNSSSIAQKVMKANTNLEPDCSNMRNEKEKTKVMRNLGLELKVLLKHGHPPKRVVCLRNDIKDEKTDEADPIFDTDHAYNIKEFRGDNLTHGLSSDVEENTSILPIDENVQRNVNEQRGSEIYENQKDDHEEQINLVDIHVNKVKNKELNSDVSKRKIKEETNTHDSNVLVEKTIAVKVENVEDYTGLQETSTPLKNPELDKNDTISQELDNQNEHNQSEFLKTGSQVENTIDQARSEIVADESGENVQQVINVPLDLRTPYQAVINLPDPSMGIHNSVVNLPSHITSVDVTVANMDTEDENVYILFLVKGQSN